MSLKEKVRSFILKKDGEKYVASKKHLIICFAVLVGIGTIALVVFKPKEDSSVVIESTQPIQADDKMPLMEQKSEESEKVNSLLESSAAVSSSTTKKIANPEVPQNH